MSFSNSYPGLIPWAIPVKLFSEECHRTPLMSTLVQVMAWCRQATSHYLSHCFPRSLSLYGVTRPQRVKINWNLVCPLHPFSSINHFEIVNWKTPLEIEPLREFCWTLRSQMAHLCVGKLYHHWFRYCLVVCPVLSHYLNQCWCIVNWIHGNYFRCIFNQNKYTGRCRYNAVNFLQNPHNRHTIARP